MKLGVLMRILIWLGVLQHALMKLGRLQASCFSARHNDPDWAPGRLSFSDSSALAETKSRSLILQAFAEDSASLVPRALPQKGALGAPVVMVPQKTTDKLRKRRVLRHVIVSTQRPSELCNHVIQRSARSPLQTFAFLVGYRKLRGVSWAVNGEPLACQQRTARSLLLRLIGSIP